MRILFLGDSQLDYVSDPLYIGLSRVLGDHQIVDYPYKPIYHDPEARYWFMAQRHGRRYCQEEILALLNDRYFDLVCLSSFRKEALDECRRLFEKVAFPPVVFIDGADDARIRHDIVAQYPINIYFKRDYVWRMGSRLGDLGALAWTFRGDRELFARTAPLPLSIVMDSLPNLGSVSKEIDVSFRGRASHPRRVRAVEILNGMEGVRFSGGVYASPGDRRYKLKAGRLSRLWAKLLDDKPSSEADQLRKSQPEAYYQEIASSRIAVALRGGGHTASLRYFEIVAMGTLLLSDTPETLIPNDFVDRRHAVYCRADLRDLEPLVRYYLREDGERDAIVQEGYAHLLKYHTCERRAEYFVDTCRRVL